ncbi:single-stranded DNA-binding protein [Gynurincola endophyticus]|uniref:single-stranded DNA-binding protein n=1 Tax=Gynurincola endophyticus TaxID=2479004 RepID=UPI000F8D3AC2|nr:single-stranded DNA-binding protein [Gynurincola endophyticus]
MANFRNRVQIVGHLGNDPEQHEYREGKKLTKVSIATNEYYIQANGEKQTDTQWHTVVFWDELGNEAAEQLRKGMLVAVEGKLMYHQYVDAQGVKRYGTDIRASHFLAVTAAK